jgi:hypothetical protein
MKLFGIGRKKKLYTVIKLFRIVNIEEAKKLELKEIITCCLDFIFLTNSLYPDNYVINFGKKSWKTNKGFLAALSNIKAEDLTLLTAYFSNNRSCLDFRNSIVNIIPSAIPEKAMVDIQISILSSSIVLDQMILFFNKMQECFSYDYGYALELDENYDFNKERKIKKGLFSQITAVERIDSIWRFHGVGILYGFVKNIYPLNILNISQINQPIINKCIQEKIGKFEWLGENLGLWILNDIELNKVRAYFQESKYVIASSNSLDYFLESVDSKKFESMMKFN